MRRAAWLVLLAAVPAQAAQPVQPVRDVVVAYRLDGAATGLIPGGLPGTVRLSWNAQAQRVRVEPEGRSQVALFDLRRHQGVLIETALRVLLPLPIRPADLQPLTLENARLSPPRGQATVAGLACTLYGVDSPGGGSVCLSADGVPLRGEGQVQGRPGRFEALSVRYGPLPPALFEPPAGYVALDKGVLGSGVLGGALGNGAHGDGLAGLAGRLGLGTLGRVPQ